MLGRNSVAPEALRAMPLDVYFDFWGVRLNGPRAEGKHIVLNWRFTDIDQTFVLNVENSALTHRAGELVGDAHATMTLTRGVLDAITLMETTFETEIAAGRIAVAGDAGKLTELLTLLDSFETPFAIVEP